MSGGIKGYLAELRRRKVIRVGVVYIIVAWLIIQVAEVTFEPLQLPGWALTFVVIVAILGFPLALVLTWGYEQEPQDEDATEPASGEPSTSDGDLQSVAVLPFVDMSPDRDQDYFCEGISEEILNTLTRIKSLHVASRTASFHFKGQTGNMAKIGRDLNVATILEGSVRKSGERLRVTAQLIQASTGYHLWSEKFDSRMEDVFDIQDRIADQIAEALKVTLTPAGTEPVHGGRTSNVEAYDFYLRGWKYFHAFGRKNLESARQMFRRAIEIDGNFARAWAGISDAAAFICLYVEETEALKKEAVEASETALELCDTIAETQASRGLSHLISKEYQEAEKRFEKAIEINPRLFEPYYFYARTCVHEDKFERAFELFAKAHEVDPADYQSAMFAGNTLEELGRESEAKDWLRRGVEAAIRNLEANPDDVRAMYLAGGALVTLGDRERGYELGERALSIEPDDGTVLYNVACLYIRGGEHERALDCLERAHINAVAISAWIQHDPDMKPLHGQPRFEALLEAIQ